MRASNSIVSGRTPISSPAFVSSSTAAVSPARAASCISLSSSSWFIPHLLSVVGSRARRTGHWSSQGTLRRWFLGGPSRAAIGDAVLLCELKARTSVGRFPERNEVAMFVNRMARYELLDPDAIETIDRGWRRLVSEIGVQFGKPEAVELFRQAGQRVDGETVRLDPEFVLEQVSKAPREFDL